MKTVRIALLVLMIALTAAALGAQASKPPAKPAPAPSGRTGDFGLIFNFQNLLVDLLPYDDGYQNGAGLKYWLSETLALRGLLGLNFNSYTPPGGTASTTTLFSLGAAAEFHARKTGKVSPYAGGFFGTRMEFLPATDPAADFYLGAMAGAEYRVLDFLSFFGEYQLRMTFDAAGTTISLADIANPRAGAVFGIILYF